MVICCIRLKPHYANILTTDSFCLYVHCYTDYQHDIEVRRPLPSFYDLSPSPRVNATVTNTPRFAVSLHISALLCMNHVTLDLN